MFRFIHSADIHLDSPLHGLERYEGAPVETIRNATREAFQNLVQLAVDEEADFLLISGDLYDGDWKDYNTGLFLVKQMRKLQEAGIRVFITAGNHDAASQITRSLRMPENVHLFSAKKPETVILGDPQAAIHGQSFSSRAVVDDLSSAYPGAVPGLFNIGMLHTCANGREGHEAYAPCSLEGLLAKGYDYWALGHVHRREVLHRDPWVVFSGNLQGRNIRETGAKGCTLVTVEDDGSVAVEHRPVDVLRWALLDVDSSGCENVEEAIERIREAMKREAAANDGCMLAVRVLLSGACRAHDPLSLDPEKWMSEVRASAFDCGDVWVEKVRFRTSSLLDLDEISRRRDPAGDLMRFMGEIVSDDESLASLSEEFAPLKSKLPPDIFQGEDAIDLQSPDRLRSLVEEARQLLISRLLAKGE